MIRVMDEDLRLPPARDPSGALLRMHGFRVTRLRRAVVSAFLAADGALSVDDLVETVGFGSLSSVYRAVEALESEGVLERCPGSAGIRRYCLARHGRCGHNHFECLGCGRVIHLDLELPPGLVERVSAEGFSIANASVHFSGKCRDCSGKGRG